ncbi:hypothetical protein P43SY_004594 [Pythium insidiosum]|uniref:Transmembrane protein n=1 Tax=Pythium insidiosum TaxID=114742 RepID=A0AAD5LL30_PYTIN|nr:hypothetical protein P43SY_004594 [Pythium insidiosum]
MTTTTEVSLRSLPVLMAASMALAAAAQAPDAHGSQDSESSGFPLAWALAVPFVPALVFAAAIVLTLELLEYPWIARGLAVALMVSTWITLLPTELQLAALLCAVVYHGIRELYVEWCRGFPSVFRPHMRAHRVTLWWLFWVRVFAWGVTFGAIGVSIQSPPLALASLVAMGLRHVILCECAEVLVLLYLADQDVKYTWRRRVVLWGLSFVLVKHFHLASKPVRSCTQRRQFEPFDTGSSA